MSLEVLLTESRTPKSEALDRLTGREIVALMNAEDARGAEDLSALDPSERDLAVGIATSGRTPYVLGAVCRAKECQAATVGLVCNPPSAPGMPVDLTIAVLVGPEAIAGSTRLKARTATKLVLNMITTGAMVRIGKTLGNRLVDLAASNEKLRLRSRRILREVAGIDAAEAFRMLVESAWELKRAVVMALAGVDGVCAKELLEAHRGMVRAAIVAETGIDAR